MKVALKFCGGCDPAYDRVEYWEKIRDAAGELISWQSLEQGGHQALLVICGCDTACVLEDLAPQEPMIVINNGQRPPAEVAAEILGKGN